MRWVLALLAMRANRIVGMSSLIDELWGETPPRSAVTTTQTYIYQLRRRFCADGMADGPESILQTRPPGYMLRVPEGRVDADVFVQLVERGAALLDSGEPAAAGGHLREALAMWRGPALSNIPPGRQIQTYSAHLAETRIRALELRIHADLRVGRTRELIPELRSLVTEHPLNEWFHARLIDALRRSGRRSEALLAYRNLRTVLRDELGLEPSTALQQLHHEVLTADQPREGLAVLPPHPVAAGMPG